MPESSDEAFGLVCRLLVEIEDEMNDIPAAVPPPPQEVDDGRMYPPQGDNVRRTADGGIMAITRGHRLVISPDGRIEVRNRLTGELEFQR